jgi:hypothetical protein
VRLRLIALGAAGVVGGAVLVNAWLAAGRRRMPVAPPEPAPVGPPAARGNGAPTRDELYEVAKRLDIKGRSKMSKAELERAVSEHGK